jgi:hypothetical protein
MSAYCDGCGQLECICKDKEMCCRCYDEVDEVFPANCKEKPEDLAGQPIGQYHCPDCGAMVMAAIPHPPMCKPCIDRKHPSFDGPKVRADNLQYWIDLEECVCESDTPIGACLKCDLTAAQKRIAELERLVKQVDTTSRRHVKLSKLKQAVDRAITNCLA